MLGRFLIALGEAEPSDPGDGETLLVRKAERLGLRKLWSGRGAWLMGDRSVPVLRLAGEEGIVLGSLFRREAEARPVGERNSPAHYVLARDEGRSLLAKYWGSYVALLRRPSDRFWLVLRDPSGAVPVYYVAEGPNLYLASSPLLLLATGLLQPEIDEAFVRHALVYPRMRTARTGLANCRELLPGMALRGDGASRLAWSPWPFTSRENRIEADDEAAASLRTEIARTIAALVPVDRKLLLELSGGVDSSIITAALAAARIPFSCVTFATRSADGDERRYARLVAEGAGVPLAELIEADNSPSLAMPPLRPRPGLTAVLRLIDEPIRLHAKEQGAGLLLNGGGGDNVFCSLTTAAPAVDALFAAGLRPAFAALRDVAAVTGSTIWTAARFAIARGVAGSRGPLWREDLRFLTAPLADTPAELHPWLEDHPRSLPGKVEHVRAIVQIFDFLDTSERAASFPMLFPLLAQPIVELCLRIPTWMWIRGGRDRAVARAAFEGLVPDPILHRSGKGRLESLFARGFAAVRPALKELLLDGLLSRKSLLDRAAIERHLARDEGREHELDYRLLGLASIELWLRSWEDETGVSRAIASQRRYCSDLAGSGSR